MQRLRVPRLPSGRARIRLRGMRHTEDSFEVRVYLDLPPGEVSDEHLAGVFAVYGVGPRSPGAQEAEGPPWDVLLEVSPSALAHARRRGPHDVTLIAERADGSPAEDVDLRFDDVVIESED